MACRGAEVCASPRGMVRVRVLLRMIELLELLLAALIDALRSRQCLLLENLLLCQQLQVALRCQRRAASTGGDATSSWSAPRPCCAGAAR